MRLAASRTFCTAGKSKPIKMAMMAMTTNSSISVKAQRRKEIVNIKDLLINNKAERQSNTERAPHAPRYRTTSASRSIPTELGNNELILISWYLEVEIYLR